MIKEFRKKFPYDINEYYIVYLVFDRMLRDDFINMLNLLKRDISIDKDGIGYYLPSIFEHEDEEGYFDDGVMFYLQNEEQKLDFKRFMQCIKVACEVYVDINPSKNEYIQTTLMFLENKYSQWLGI